MLRPGVTSKIKFIVGTILTPFFSCRFTFDLLVGKFAVYAAADILKSQNTQHGK